MWSVGGAVLAALLCVLHQVCSQDAGSSDFFKNLNCITHDMENMICRWDTPYPADRKILYRVCSRSPMNVVCFETTRNQLEVEFHIFSESDISIEAKDVPENPSIRIQKTSEDIPFVPYPPEIRSLVADYQSDILYVDWSVNTTAIINGVQLACEMNVLRDGHLLAANETVVEYWFSHIEMFRWNWTSDFPLNCSSYSARVRCFVHEEDYNGEKRMSDWSAAKTVSADTSESVFPEDIVVPVGSSVNFCCKLDAGNRISAIKFKSDNISLVDLGNSSSGIRLTNLQKSTSSGDNIVCLDQDKQFITGTVVFVGYPPDRPQDFSCEARHLKVINCTWKAGRDTGLYGPERGTKYSLYERFSKINTSCSGYNEDLDEYNCSFDIKKEQQLHEFLLLARNPLRTSNISLAINVLERIHPYSVERFLIHDTNASEVYLSWYLPGTFTSVNLSCQIEIKPIHGETETRNVTLEGLNDGHYHCSIGDLHPFHVYDFRVRCASYDHFWKWSNWCSAKRHRTLTAAPSKKLDIWREVLCSPEDCDVIVYWKHLTLREANGIVTSYRVTWRPLHSADPPEEMLLPADLNKTSINLTSSEEQEYEIYVTAINSAGFYKPSRITTIQPPSDVSVERIEGDGSGINITWSPEPDVSCGYLVKWVPSCRPLDPALMWKRFPSSAASGFISSKYFQAGLRYNVSLYGCQNDGDHHLLKEMVVYAEELAPLVAPNFTIQETTSRSILVRWEAISEENLRGFLQGYLVYVVKAQNDSAISPELVRHTETKIKNITDPAVRILKIEDLQSGTSYTLGLQAYTKGGMGPIKSFSVLTNDNAVGLILAILVPIVVAVVLGIVASAICYHKREWIKETFYPDIPNPENSKALQFPKNVTEGGKTIKTLEMNRCTPSSVEVVEPFPKILDTELNSPISDSGEIPEDGSEEDNHAGIIYTQPASHDDTSNPVLDGSASPSVVYIDVQSMYQPQGSSEEEPEVDFAGGYKPQMQLPISSVNVDNQAPAEDEVAASSGYRPQGNPNTWAADSPGSPTSLGSENASFGSPCSVNSRHFLIPPVDTKDSLKPSHAGWSISSLFQTKQEE